MTQYKIALTYENHGYQITVLESRIVEITVDDPFVVCGKGSKPEQYFKEVEVINIGNDLKASLEVMETLNSFIGFLVEKKILDKDVFRFLKGDY